MNITNNQTNIAATIKPCLVSLKFPLTTKSKETSLRNLFPTPIEPSVKKSSDIIISNPGQSGSSSHTIPNFLYKIFSGTRYASLPGQNGHVCVPAADLKMPKNPLATRPTQITEKIPEEFSRVVESSTKEDSHTPNQLGSSSDTSPNFLYKIFSGKSYACLPGQNGHLCVPAADLKMPTNSLVQTARSSSTVKPFTVTPQIITLPLPKNVEELSSSAKIDHSIPAGSTSTETAEPDTAEKVAVSAKGWFSNLPALSTMFKIGIAVLALAGISYAAYTYFTPSRVEEEAVSPIKPPIEKPLTFFERIQKALSSIWISIQSWIKKLLTLSSK